MFFIEEAKTFISHCFLDKRTDIKEGDVLFWPYQVIYHEFLQLYNRDKDQLRQKGTLKNGLARKDVAWYAREIGQSRSEIVVNALQVAYQHVKTPLYKSSTVLQPHLEPMCLSFG